MSWRFLNLFPILEEKSASHRNISQIRYLDFEGGLADIGVMLEPSVPFD